VLRLLGKPVGVLHNLGCTAKSYVWYFPPKKQLMCSKQQQQQPPGHQVALTGLLSQPLQLVLLLLHI